MLAIHLSAAYTFLFFASLIANVFFFAASSVASIICAIVLIVTTQGTDVKRATPPPLPKA